MSPMSNIEPICAALNLCRFLILREIANNSNITQVCISALLCGFCNLKTPMHVAVPAATPKSDHTAMSMLLQICTPEISKQLQINTGLLAVALQAQMQIETSADVEMILAVSRGMEVLSRIRELLAKQD